MRKVANVRKATNQTAVAKKVRIVAAKDSQTAVAKTSQTAVKDVPTALVARNVLPKIQVTHYAQ